MVCGAEGAIAYSGMKDPTLKADGRWDFRRCSNRECEVLWLDPRPQEKDLALAYRGYTTHDLPKDAAMIDRVGAKLAAGYRRVRHGYRGEPAPLWARVIGWALGIHPGWRARRDVEVMFQGANPGGLLLDVGCGNGELLRLVRCGGWKGQGVDQDPEAVAVAHRRALDARVGSLEGQGYAGGRFDAVTMRHVIEHVRDPLGLLREGLRVLKPGGVLMCATPNARSWGHRRYVRRWRPLDPPRHLHLFTVGALETLARRAGYGNIKLHTQVPTVLGELVADDLMRRTVGHVIVDPELVVARFWTTVVHAAAWVHRLGGREDGEEIILRAVKS